MDLGVLNLTLVAQEPCWFKLGPATVVHAALLRRLELLDPELSRSLHDTPAGNVWIERPWTISQMLGPLEPTANGLLARPGVRYHIRLTALNEPMVRALDEIFFADHPLAGEPLYLEDARFSVLQEQSRWDSLATYASLLTAARPQRRIVLQLLSPTGFHVNSGEQLPLPDPAHCVASYLRKWNAFADVLLPEEPLLSYARSQVTLARHSLTPATMKVGRGSVGGVKGRVEWEAQTVEPASLRLVNGLADYAVYCGTGMHATRGMGQTARLNG